MSTSHLSIRYPGQQQAAVDGVSLGLRTGDIGVLIGPSGCGKTTLLRAVAGLERASGGSIVMGGETVSNASHHMPAEQAYMLCSVCGDLRISEIVDQPNWVVSFYFPRIVLS